MKFAAPVVAMWLVACSAPLPGEDAAQLPDAAAEASRDVQEPDGGVLEAGQDVPLADAQDASIEADSARNDVVGPDAPSDASGDSAPCPDGDGDGHRASSCGGDDCDDTNPRAFPGQGERCDGVDTDCNGHADDRVESRIDDLCVSTAPPDTRWYEPPVCAFPGRDFSMPNVPSPRCRGRYIDGATFQYRCWDPTGVSMPCD